MNIKNPALAFIPNANEQKAEEKPEETPIIEEKKAAADVDQTERLRKAPKGYKINPAFLEVKSQRVQLVLQPSVVKRLKKAAAKKKLSVNETANTAIIEFLEREGF